MAEHLANDNDDQEMIKRQMEQAHGHEHHEPLGISAPFWWNGWQAYLSSLDSIVAATDPWFDRLQAAYERGSIDTYALSDEALEKLGLQRIKIVEIETAGQYWHGQEIAALQRLRDQAEAEGLTVDKAEPEPEPTPVPCAYSFGYLRCSKLEHDENEAHDLMKEPETFAEAQTRYARETGGDPGDIPIRACEYQAGQYACELPEHGRETKHKLRDYINNPPTKTE